ncbi:MAG TPA: IS1182 family transposase [Armatimonadota bacterium]
MLGRRKKQVSLFDVGNVWPLELPEGSFHGQLAQAAPRLFQDEAFLSFYSERVGRPSVPPSQLALMLLLQQQAGCSDEEAVERSGFDLRWAAVLGRHAGAPLCAKSTLQLFRSHLILHEGVRQLFEGSLQEARRAGLLKGGKLKVAVDTKPMLGKGAVEDTYNLLAAGIQQVTRVLAMTSGEKLEAWVARQGLGRYFGPSLKGSAELDWSDPQAREAFLTEIVRDARRLLHWASFAGEAQRERVKEACELLSQLLLQDVEWQEPPEGGPRAQLKRGTAPDRIPSVSDPEQRHGHKSASKRFTGHKVAVVVDRESQLILDCAVLPGNAGDAQGVLEAIERVEETTGQAVEQVVGDGAYGSGATRQAFQEAGRELVVRAPRASRPGGRFPKSAFGIDLAGESVTCPAGQTTRTFVKEKDGGRLYQFGAACTGCPLRSQCTTSAAGRQVRVHPQEALLQAARAYQQTPEGQAVLSDRVVVEHGLARLGALGVGQARYRGRAKSRCQALLAATLANLRWTWNWVARQGRPGPASSDSLTRSSRTKWPGGWALLGLTPPHFWPYRSLGLAA